MPKGMYISLLNRRLCNFCTATDRDGVCAITVIEPTKQSNAVISFDQTNVGIKKHTAKMNLNRDITLAVAHMYSGKERSFQGEHLWARSYAVSTVSFDELDAISEYLATR